MSNNIYNILNSFNKVAQEPQQPAPKATKPKTQLQESMEQVLSRKLVAEKKKNDGNLANNAKPYDKVTRGDVIAGRLGKDEMGGKKVKEAKDDYTINGKKVTKAAYEKEMKKAGKKVEEDSTGDYSAKKARAGKDIGKPGKNFAKIAKGAAERYGSKERGEKVAGAVLAKLRAKESIEEVAPPGEKAERMVKHIKKGYAKDGKLTPKEKGIAYATAWKAHNKGKIEEAIRAMMEAGFTKEQIVEGWDEMMKSVKDRAHSMKTGEKRAGHKGEIEKTSTGVKHTRRYDPKTGETETGSDGEQVKRGRGRPKKSAFESKQLIKKMIAESFAGFFEGSIQGGVWTANKGNVPAPMDPEGVPTKAAPYKGPLIIPANGAPFIPSIKADIAPKTGISGQAAQDLMKSSDPNIYNKLTGQQTPAKLTPAPTDPEGVKEDDVEEGNYFSGQLAKARAAGKKHADLDGDGDMEQVREDEEELDESKCNECGMYESKCKCDKVSESLSLFRKLAGLQECMSPISGAAQDMQDSQGKMNINTSMDSDGHKSVTITADGDAAGELMQMLKLAGMGGHEGHNHGEPAGVMVVAGDEDQEVDEEQEPSTANKIGQAVGQTAGLGSIVPRTAANLVSPPNKEKQSDGDSQSFVGGVKKGWDNTNPAYMAQNIKQAMNPQTTKEAKDERYHANTTPEEEVMPIQQQTKGGNGDVAGQEKKMTKHGYKFSDNPKAMEESMSLKLIKEYEGIKVKK